MINGFTDGRRNFPLQLADCQFCQQIFAFGFAQAEIFRVQLVGRCVILRDLQRDVDGKSFQSQQLLDKSFPNVALPLLHCRLVELVELHQLKLHRRFVLEDVLDERRHDGQVEDRVLAVLGELHLELAVDLCVGRRLQERREGQAALQLPVLQMVLDQVDDVLDAALLQPELLLVEASVLDAAAEIVQSLPLDDVRQHELLRFDRLVLRDPKEVADVQFSDFVRDVARFQLAQCVVGLPEIYFLLIRTFVKLQTYPADS